MSLRKLLMILSLAFATARRPCVPPIRSCRAVQSAAFQLTTHPLHNRNHNNPRRSSNTKSSFFASNAAAESSSSTPKRTISDNELHTEEHVVKKSRFIGIATHCTSWEQAQSQLAKVRTDHPKSRHVCFGFVSSSGENGAGGIERCSDDGEPTGTAGVPILGAIKGEGLSDTLCIVVRYFGGVKLGAGGLIRAYGGSARLVLRSCPTQTHVPKSTVRLSTRTANSGAVYTAAAKFGGVTSGERYNDRGELELSILCDQKDERSLRDDLVDATRGDVMFLQ